MDQLDREAEPNFTQPFRQLSLMVIVLALVAFGAYVAFPQVAPVFLANLWLNGFIAAVFAIGIVTCFVQVFQINSSVGWIEGFVSNRPGHQLTRAPRLLAPLAALLRSRGAQTQIGASSSRSILDSVATRIDEARDITRYIVNLLIFLGLLGTFFGLATTVPAVVETIRSLAPQEGEEGIQVFNRLMSGLEDQLGGMGVAFSSSLLGLAGSLVVGLLELFASHGQNRFYRELEEWLSTITRLGFSAVDTDGSDQGAVMALAELMSSRMDAMQDMLTARTGADLTLEHLASTLGEITRRLDATADGAGSDAARLANAQERLADAIEAQSRDGTGGGGDAESRMRLRSMDVQLLRILEELSAGRQETVADLRTDLQQLTKAVRALGRPTAERR